MTDEPQTQPSIPAAPVEPESCGSCMFLQQRSQAAGVDALTYYMCRRYPQYQQRRVDEWCGEYRRRA